MKSKGEALYQDIDITDADDLDLVLQYFQPTNFPSYKPGKDNIAKFDVEYSDHLMLLQIKSNLREFKELDTKISLTNPE